MFVRVFLFSIILLLVSQACVKASTNSIQCGPGIARCCEKVREINGRRNAFMLTCIVKGLISTGQC
jgi:hypothetical protein